jgi:divalent metal cation (Fe/Co/Zn/Cd) transporter
VDESLAVSEAHGLVTFFEEAFLEAVSDVDNVVTHIDPVGEASAVQQSEAADEGPVRQEPVGASLIRSD